MHVNADVDGCCSTRRAARGVRLAGGREIEAAKGVICSVTPNQLYGRLLAERRCRRTSSNRSSQYRYGKGNFQVHYALKAPPKWKTPELGERGAHASDARPRRRFEGRQRSRARHAAGDADDLRRTAAPRSILALPGGRGILWLQLPEAPRFIKGDAAGEIGVPADGKWTEAVRERYADRIEAILASHIDGFREK